MFTRGSSWIDHSSHFVRSSVESYGLRATYPSNRHWSYRRIAALFRLQLIVIIRWGRQRRRVESRVWSTSMATLDSSAPMDPFRTVGQYHPSQRKSTPSLLAEGRRNVAAGQTRKKRLVVLRVFSIKSETITRQFVTNFWYKHSFQAGFIAVYC